MDSKQTPIPPQDEQIADVCRNCGCQEIGNTWVRDPVLKGTKGPDISQMDKVNGSVTTPISPATQQEKDRQQLIVAWKCRTCGCLWRDNFDDYVSLFNTESKSCAECEHMGTRETCDPLTAKQLYDLGLLAGRHAEREKMKEVCICAAVLTKEGRIFRGHRHDDAIQVAGNAGFTPSSLAATQGFLTSFGRYVNREEAARLQEAAGIRSIQTQKFTNLLFSEDLY